MPDQLGPIFISSSNKSNDLTLKLPNGISHADYNGITIWNSSYYILGIRPKYNEAGYFTIPPGGSMSFKNDWDFEIPISVETNDIPSLTIGTVGGSIYYNNEIVPSPPLTIPPSPPTLSLLGSIPIGSTSVTVTPSVTSLALIITGAIAPQMSVYCEGSVSEIPLFVTSLGGSGQFVAVLPGSPDDTSFLITLSEPSNYPVYIWQTTDQAYVAAQIVGPVVPDGSNPHHLTSGSILATAGPLTTETSFASGVNSNLITVLPSTNALLIIGGATMAPKVQDSGGNGGIWPVQTLQDEYIWQALVNGAIDAGPPQFVEYEVSFAAAPPTWWVLQLTKPLPVPPQPARNLIIAAPAAGEFPAALTIPFACRVLSVATTIVTYNAGLAPFLSLNDASGNLLFQAPLTQNPVPPTAASPYYWSGQAGTGLPLIDRLDQSNLGRSLSPLPDMILPQGAVLSFSATNALNGNDKWGYTFVAVQPV